MIVVVIIGLLAVLAIPAFMRVQARSQTSVVANNFRVFAEAFEIYNTQNGSWPGNVGPGLVPPGMGTGDFKVGTWRSTTPIGGVWNWDNMPSRAFGYSAAISISGFTCSDAQLTAIDTLIDDGNLATGYFQKVAADRASFILAQ